MSDRSGIEYAVIDITDLVIFYRQQAPAVLSNFIDFKDYVSILVSTQPTPCYTEVVMETLIDLITSKIKNNQNIDTLLTNQLMENIDIYSQLFIDHMDKIVAYILGTFTNYDPSSTYQIYRWLSDNHLIISYNHVI